MLRKLAFVFVALIAVSGALLVQRPPSAAHAQTENCASADDSAAREMLVQAQNALNSGDVATAIQLETSARQTLRQLFHECAVTPMLQEMGFDQARIDAVAQMPFCEYRFEATVRSGPNAGLALMGRLALMQDTATSAVGYVYPLAETATPVPVSVELAEDNAVTLTFAVGENAAIVGTGYFTAGIQACFGGIEGVFAGPASDDVGDWLGLPCTLNPSSASCTPTVSLDPNLLPVLQPSNPQKPVKEPSMCTPIRDAACQAACGLDFNCRLNCPVVGETCS